MRTIQQINPKKRLRKVITLTSLVFLISLSILSCKSTIKSSQKKAVDNSVETCEAISFTELSYTELETDYYQVDSVFIIDNCLNIWVSYSGGCGDSEFNLYFNNLIMESMPPKANLLLQFKDEDNCRAVVQQKLYYDISFFEEYASNEGINIRLAGIGKPVLFKK